MNWSTLLSVVGKVLDVVTPLEALLPEQIDKVINEVGAAARAVAAIEAAGSAKAA